MKMRHAKHARPTRVVHRWARCWSEPRSARKALRTVLVALPGINETLRRCHFFETAATLEPVRAGLPTAYWELLK